MKLFDIGEQSLIHEVTEKKNDHKRESSQLQETFTQQSNLIDAKEDVWRLFCHNLIMKLIRIALKFV